VLTGPGVVPRKAQTEAWTSKAIDADDFESYKVGIIHDWLRTLTVLAAILVPLFFVLDYLMLPNELLPRFGVYRLISTAIALPSWWSCAGPGPVPGPTSTDT